jgi:predicted nucleic acid-binding protein
MIFVDTGIWYAADVPEDPAHSEARRLLLNATSTLVTTDYVIDALLTLLVARGHHDIAIAAGNRMWQETSATLEWVRVEDVRAAWNVFTSFVDKSWSFTDCVSRAVMKRLGITAAFALDDHFRQFGFATVQP